MVSEISIDLSASTAGQRAIAGFLLQIVRSIKLGLYMSLAVKPLEDGAQMTLHLEPAKGSDVKVVGGPRDIVEQIKMRKDARKWTTDEVASKVLPDLLKAAQVDKPQLFRFVTNNIAGLGPLATYIATRSSPARRQRWGNSSVSREEFEDRLATAAGKPGITPDLRHLLDNLEIEIIDLQATEAEIEASIRPLLKPGQDASDKRFQLIGQLMTLASGGAMLTPDDLFALISPDAHRLLAHIQALPALLARHVDEDARLIGYIPEVQARRALPEVLTNFAVLSGESGQGKTWTLAQLAFGQIERGELAIVMRSPTSIKEVVGLVNERIWQPVYAQHVTLSVMARHLGEAFRDESGNWLTLYIDDVQDRTFAERLARQKWDQLGIRLLVSSQPRITRAIQTTRSDTEVIAIDNFRSADLQRYLTHHGRQEALQSIPDDVLELLRKPVHASIFVQLPARQSWSGASEYELFSAYWHYASLEARSQSDHPGDGWSLKMLARTLVDGKGNYPWRVADLRGARLNDPAILRLEQVSLLRRPVPDRIQFATDRMLNWAVAEALAEQIVDEPMSAGQADALLERVSDLTTKNKDPIGNRLGYVYYDVLWLLAGSCAPDFVAELVWELISRQPQENRQEDRWRSGFGSVGVRLLPALELLARRVFDEERDWDVPRNIPIALAAIAASDPQPVQALIARQVSASLEAEVRVGLRAAKLVPAPSALEAIWSQHLARSRAIEALSPQTQADRRWEAISRREVSSDALRAAIKENPAWLDEKLASAPDVVAINQLLWLLRDERVVDTDVASGIWLKHRDRIVQMMPVPSPALVEAIGHFSDASLCGMLDAVDASDDWNGDRRLSSRARIAPQTAIRQIAQGADNYGWRSANWWIDELLAADRVSLSRAIRTRAGSGDDPLTDLVFFYGLRPEAMDSETLEEVLDRFAERLREFNRTLEDPQEREGRLAHPLRFLPKLSEPWQFDALRRRAGTPLEQELSCFAARRRGRTSMTRDRSGHDAARILAMIGGTGYDRLAIAELGRANIFGRQDGYVSALWSQSDNVRMALSATPNDKVDATFGHIARMDAMAAHQLDDGLEAMLQQGCFLYVDAANIRSSRDRDLAGMRRRIGELLAHGDLQSLEMAAALAGFLRPDDDVAPLVTAFNADDTPISARRRLIGSFHALGFYDPRMFGRVSAMLSGQMDDDARFLATYLAESGDAAARRLVIGWIATQDLGTNSSSHRGYLAALLEHPEGRQAVLAYLRRSRMNGHLVIEGEYLQILAEDGECWAHEELDRASYHYSGFNRSNAVAAIDFLGRSEPDEAYFAAQRLLTRHSLPAAADLMLILAPARAGPELLARYQDARPSLRLALRRCLRTRLRGDALSDLLLPMARAAQAGPRAIAAEVSGVIPPNVPVPWLDELIRDRSPAVRTAARDAVRCRNQEAAAMAHLEVLPAEPKPAQWTRLARIIELVDPYFLWWSGDPSSLQRVLSGLPYEFTVEARKLRTASLKERDDAARRADKKS